MVNAAIVTVSDRVSRGEAEDRGGALLKEGLEASGQVTVRSARRVTDDEAAIRELLVELARGHDLVVTTGGTGLGPRDVTPEATAQVIERRLPGLEEALRAEGRKKTPLAVLARGLAGSRGDCLIVNLPGSPNAVKDGVAVLLPVVSHICELLRGAVKDCADARAQSATTSAAKSGGSGAGPGDVSRPGSRSGGGAA